MKPIIVLFALFAVLACAQTPTAYANVVTVRDLPASLQQFYPPHASDFIQAFILDEPEGSANQIEVAYQMDGETYSHGETHTAGAFATVVLINVTDGRKATPLAVRVNGAVLWGSWPSVVTPRIRRAIKRV